MARITGIADLPGFQESLRLLVVEEKYSLHDIGLMFGVSRERIRQLAMKFKIPYAEEEKHRRGMKAYRVWNEKLHRFVPVSRKLHRQGIYQKQVTERRVKHEENIVARQVLVLETIEYLRRKHEREPTWTEVARELGYEGDTGALMHVLSKWGRVGRARASTQLARSTFIAETGFKGNVSMRGKGPRKRWGNR